MPARYYQEDDYVAKWPLNILTGKLWELNWDKNGGLILWKSQL